jgi:hypothetical protein
LHTTTMRIGLVVHGVGNHLPGAVLKQAVYALGDNAGDSVWHEFNWSKIPGIADRHMLTMTNIRSMTKGMAVAARLGSGRNPLAVTAELIFGIATTLPLLSPLITFLLLVGPQLSFWDAIELQIIVFGWTLASVSILATTYLLVALTRTIFWRSATPLAEWLRWLTLLLARPIVLICLLPFSPLLFMFLRWGDDLATPLMWITVTGLFAAAFGWLWGEPYAALGNLAILALLIAGLCLAWIAGQLVYFLFGPTLKALLDVFRYLGDTTLRRTLHDEFDRLIFGLPDDKNTGRRISIYAHSLGSVITLYSLLYSPAWNESDHIELVTFGSPLRRLIMRFFLGALFPRTITEIHSQINERVCRFCWTNYYRPLDYVGGSLGLTRVDAGLDLRSPTWWKSHSGYFADAEMWRTTAAVLNNTSAGAVANDVSAVGKSVYLDTQKPYEPAIGVGKPKVLARAARLITWSGFALAPLAAVLYIITAVATGGQFQGKLSEMLREELSTSGRISPATVTQWTEEIPGENPDEIDHFRFAYSDGTEREIEVSQSDAAFAGYNALFSVDDLRDLVRSRCDLEHRPAPLQREIRIPCRARAAINVRICRQIQALSIFPPCRRTLQP